jgi:tetratricopeptide (TPR) repeat protein
MFRPALFHSIVLGCLSLLLSGCGDKKAALEKKYQTALEQLETGDADARNEARLTIASLAGFHEERPQHAGAHRWMGLDLFSKSDPRRPREARANLGLAERHLLRAIEMDGGDEEAIFAITQVRMRNGKAEEAIPLLTERIATMPGLGVFLAWIYDEKGDEAKAKEAAEIGVRHWSAVVSKEPSNIEARLRWVRCEMLRGGDEEALRILAEGRSLQADRRFDSFEVMVRMRQADRAIAATPSAVDRSIGFLEEAQRLAPSNPAVINRLAQIAGIDEASRNQVREVFSRIIASGLAGWTVHHSLGELEMKAGDLPAAIDSFKLARTLAPRNPFPANDLAWCLAHLDPPQLDEALKVSDQLLTLQPAFKENPMGQRTRGTILLKLGKIDEGMAELEKALPLLDGEMQEDVRKRLEEARSTKAGS